MDRPQLHHPLTLFPHPIAVNLGHYGTELSHKVIDYSPEKKEAY
jgi:hypothetical protein